MGVNGIYDYDFFHYQNCIPNLECAKLCSYFRNHKSISVLVPKMDPAPYTDFYIRKDYEDYNYPDEFFLPNVHFGGQAFNKIYTPMDLDIEATHPIFLPYEKYKTQFSNISTKLNEFKTLLLSEHMRLSLDQKEVWPDFDKQLRLSQHTNIVVLHDYDLATIKDAPDALKDILTRYALINGLYYPRRLATKFPIHLKSTQDIDKWLDLKISYNKFYCQYDGIMEDEGLIILVNKHQSLSKQIYYNPLAAWKDQNHFVEVELPKIFKQILFLRRLHFQILLIYDTENPLISDIILKTIKLFYHYAKARLDNNIISSCTLYRYITSSKAQTYFNKEWFNDAREVFYFIQEHNPELFKAFYEYDEVELKGGEFIYVPKRN